MLYLVSFLSFNVEKYRDLEIPVKGQSRSLKVVALETVYGTLLVLYSLSLKRTVFEKFDFKNAVTLKTGLGIRRGH